MNTHGISGVLVIGFKLWLDVPDDVRQEGAAAQGSTPLIQLACYRSKIAHTHVTRQVRSN
jgi:hypothetical protein